MPFVLFPSGGGSERWSQRQVANCVWIWPVSPCAAVSGELEWTSTYLSRCHLLNINYILHFYVAYVPVILSNFTCWTLSMLGISHLPIIPLRIYTSLIHLLFLSHCLSYMSMICVYFFTENWNKNQMMIYLRSRSEIEELYTTVELAVNGVAVFMVDTRL